VNCAPSEEELMKPKAKDGYSIWMRQSEYFRSLLEENPILTIRLLMLKVLHFFSWKNYQKAIPVFTTANWGRPSSLQALGFKIEETLTWILGLQKKQLGISIWLANLDPTQKLIFITIEISYFRARRSNWGCDLWFWPPALQVNPNQGFLVSS